MKLYIKIFQDNNFGNYRSDILIIPHNKIKVYKLKLIIQEKYGINHSNQKLTMKMCNRQFITMTNDFPLNFYFIRENSILYIEFIEKNSKIKEISRKLKQREIKNKYLRSIGIISNTPMEIIKESTIEDIYDKDSNTLINRRVSFGNIKSLNNITSYKSSKNITNITFTTSSRSIPIKQNSTKHFEMPKNNFQKKIKERLNKAIIGNKIEEFKEIMGNGYDFINLNAPLDNYRYSPIHYVSMYGYSELLQILINRHRVNVNLISSDNWTALHLSSYKGHIDIVNILLQCKDINYNLCLDKIGTPLHCACKRNNFKIVSLLLLKSDPLITNNEGLLPIDMTSDPNIKKIINKIVNKSNYNYNYNYINNINETDIKVKNDKNTNINIDKKNKKINPNFQYNYRTMDFINFTFLKNIKQIPNLPPKYKGLIYKKGNKLSHYNLRFIEIDPIKGFLLRFLTEEDYPNKPKEVTLLNNIKHIHKIEENISKKYFYIELIIEKGNHIYRFQNIKARNNWFDAINNCINFKKFWNKIEKKYAETNVYLNSLKQELMEINYQNGEIKKVEEKKNKKMRQRNKNIYTNKREEEFKLSEDNILNYSNIGFNSFELLDCLGAGSFGKVFKVRMKSNGEIYAMKVINKNFLIKNNQLKYAITECNVLKQVNSPFILTLHYSFQTANNLYMIIDYCPGGDLSFHIMQSVFEEDEAKFYIAELILGIEHLHKLNIIYRDLKPENILISSDNHIKLADFGLAKEGVNDSTMAKNFCGSPAYLSPEMIIRKGAGKSADMYGIGACLYEMIQGTPPFYSNNIRTLYRNITQSKLMLPEYFSDELKDLLKQLLCKDPYKRIGVLDKNEIKSHIWFKDLDWEKIAAKEIKPPLDLIEQKNNIEKDNLDDKLKAIQINFHDTDFPNYEVKKDDINNVQNFTFVKN